MRPANAGSLLAVPHVGGGLIGGASLKADDFLAIARAARGICKSTGVNRTHGKERTLTQPNGDAAFESLIRYIQESRGIDFRGYKRTSLHRRISLRMEHLHVDSFADYHAFLEAHPQEFVDLLNTVLINVTSFFRDPDAWDALKTDGAASAHRARPRARPVACVERGLRLGRGTIFSGHAALRAAWDRRNSPAASRSTQPTSTKPP